MAFAARMDEYGRAAWIAAVVLGFWVAWPLGLAVLAFAAISGRLRPWRMEAPGRWQGLGGRRGRGGLGGLFGGGFGFGGGGGHSGNAAFDEYRAETLRRLEEEQREFVDYLERLRQARDKAEFDAFMAERQRRATPVRDPV